MRKEYDEAIKVIGMLLPIVEGSLEALTDHRERDSSCSGSPDPELIEAERHMQRAVAAAKLTMGANKRTAGGE